MKKKTLLAIIFSAVLVVVAVFATFAVAADRDSDADTYADTTVSEASSESTETVDLFGKIMASTTIDEFAEIVEGATEAELNAMTDEQLTQVTAHVNELNAKAAESETADDEIENDIVKSEISVPTVDYTEVAPFGDPVVGGAK